MIRHHFVALLLVVTSVWLGHAPTIGPAIAFLTALAWFVGEEVHLSKLIAAALRPGLEADRILFAALCADLPTQGSISFLAQHDMGGAFRRERLDDLRHFDAVWVDPEHEFHHRGLERRRKDLVDAAADYLDFLGEHTGPLAGPKGAHIHSIRREQDGAAPSEAGATAQRLHELANCVVDCHAGLLRFGKKTLGV